MGKDYTSFKGLVFKKSNNYEYLEQMRPSRDQYMRKIKDEYTPKTEDFEPKDPWEWMQLELKKQGLM